MRTCGGMTPGIPPRRSCARSPGRAAMAPGARPRSARNQAARSDPRRGQGQRGFGRDHPHRGPSRPAAGLDLRVGRFARGGASDLEGAGHAQPGRAGTVPRQAAHLPDREAGRHDGLAAGDLPEPVHHPLREELHGHVLDHAGLPTDGRGPGLGRTPTFARDMARWAARIRRADGIPSVPGVWEGDTPSFLHLVSAVRGMNDPEKPDQGGWGGKFVRPDASKNHWFDDPAGTQDRLPLASRSPGGVRPPCGLDAAVSADGYLRQIVRISKCNRGTQQPILQWNLIAGAVLDSVLFRCAAVTFRRSSWAMNSEQRSLCR